MISINPMWTTFPALHDELVQVEKVIQDNIQLRNKQIEAALVELTSGGGKLVRPAFLLLFSVFGSKRDVTQLTKSAAAMEILHLATLIHDDVIDDSPLRRGVPTIHTHYGQRNAIYAGDYLFTIYFELINETARNREDVHLNALLMRRILLGELDQMRFDFKTGMTLKDYLREIDGKTAALFQLSCEFGARLTDAPQQIQKTARRIGHNIGMAFQILDDILDYTKSADEILKPAGEDLRSETYSVPLLFAARNYPELPQLLQAPMTEAHVNELVQLVAEYGVPDAKQLANDYTQKALQQIETLPNSGNKAILKDLTEALLARSF
ncbi:polyprenyl synthetase family protein [Agrilactobacillus fermenti]|uniref:polyprenyl synthetase family protein n=1 Tax=Agrilactobacillus fermenti TaxID=2586909 RepID=UPI001E5216F6|nr:polyprenyl synthetase family protein [Agrilactobacillus fermenti]